MFWWGHGSRRHFTQCASTCPCASASAAGHCVCQWCKHSKMTDINRPMWCMLIVCPTWNWRSRFVIKCWNTDFLIFAYTLCRQFSRNIVHCCNFASRFDFFFFLHSLQCRIILPSPELYCAYTLYSINRFYFLCGHMCPLFWTSTPLPCFQGSSSASPPPAALIGHLSKPQVKLPPGGALCCFLVMWETFCNATVGSCDLANVSVLSRNCSHLRLPRKCWDKSIYK